MPLRSYHFSLGNSSVGPIGFCARIQATSKERAVRILQAVLPDEDDLTSLLRARAREIPSVDWEAVEYLNVYFNASAITVRDIDESEAVS